MAAFTELQGLDLCVYSATWCGDCRRLERWLAEHRLVCTKVDIEVVPGAAERLERETGKRAIPFLLVNGKRWVRGYHPVPAGEREAMGARLPQGTAQPLRPGAAGGGASGSGPGLITPRRRGPPGAFRPPGPGR